MAVLPTYQRRGMGSQLVEAGFTVCHNTPYGVVVVLGHPHYYPRFGFTPATLHGLVWEHDVPEAMFIGQTLREGALTQTMGVVKYRPAFDVVSSEEETIMSAQHDPLALPRTLLPAQLWYNSDSIRGRAFPSHVEAFCLPPGASCDRFHCTHFRPPWQYPRARSGPE